MISDEELHARYDQAFNRRMVAVDGISSRCHADGLRAVAAYAAQRQREMEPTPGMLDALQNYAQCIGYISEGISAMQRAAPLVTDKPNV